jgi:hypothetical protein
VKKIKKIMALGLAAIMTVGATGFTANAVPPSKAVQKRVRQVTAEWDPQGKRGLELFTGVFRQDDTKHKPDRLLGDLLRARGMLFIGAFPIGRAFLADRYHGGLGDIAKCGYRLRYALEEYVDSCIQGELKEDRVKQYPAFAGVKREVDDMVAQYDGLLNRTEERYGVTFDRVQLYTDLIQIKHYDGPATEGAKEKFGLK